MGHVASAPGFPTIQNVATIDGNSGIWSSTMMDENKIREAIARYKFYHVIQLTDTITTPGWADFVPTNNLSLKHLESLDLKGKHVLDIGCRDGLFSFKAECMGAAEVVGIDNDLSEAPTQFSISFLIISFK